MISAFCLYHRGTAQFSLVPKTWREIVFCRRTYRDRKKIPVYTQKRGFSIRLYRADGKQRRFLYHDCSTISCEDVQVVSEQ